MILVAIGNEQDGYAAIVRDREGKRELASCMHRHMAMRDALACARELVSDIHFLRRIGQHNPRPR